MTKCGECGHDNKGWFRLQDREFIINNAPDGMDFYSALAKFVNDYEILRNKLARYIGEGGYPGLVFLETFRKFFDVISNIDTEHVCDCGREDDIG